jgi:hypothetical protein
MATRNWVVERDSSVFNNAYGNTVDQHHPVGLWIVAPNSYTFRAYLRFTLDFSGMVSISSAILYMRTTGEVHVGRGSGPTIRVRKLTATLNNTQGSSAEGSWSGSASPHAWVSSTTTDQSAATNMVDADNTWDTVDITAIAQAWLAGGTNYGIEVKAENEGTEADTWEFYSKDSSYDPYVLVTYTTNTAPTSPIEMTPTGGAIASSLTPTLHFKHADPQSDDMSSYDLQVSTDSTFASVTHWNISAQTTGKSGTPPNVVVDRTYAGTGLTNGSTYYWRARTKDPGGLTGPWSAAQQFKAPALPTVTVTEPSATGRLGKESYTAGAAWASPRLNVAWTFADADGGAQSKYELEVYDDSAGNPGTPLYQPGQITSSASSVVVPATFTEGNYYHVRVRLVCSHGQTSAWSSYFRIRMRWGLTTHRRDLGSAPTGWSVPTLNTTTGANSAVVIEYNSSTDGTTLPDPWKADLASVTLRQWMHYRAYLLAWGSSPATSPSLDRLVLNYTVLTLAPDKWTLQDSANAFVDTTGVFVYGTQSLKLVGKGSDHNASQAITVLPNTKHILSGQIKSLGNSGGQIIISTGATSGTILATTALAAQADFTKLNTAVWDSGANTSVYIRCMVTGAAGTAAWFDAIKMEASSVVTPWQPGYVGAGVAIDAGGLQVDARTGHGGIFRLQASAGGARDKVELGTNGLVFGGDTPVYSPAANVLRADSALRLNADVQLRRSASKILTLEDDAGAVLTGIDLLQAELRRFLISKASVNAAVATEGSATWDDTWRGLLVGDGVQAKGVTPVGWAVWATHPREPVTDTFGTAVNLAVVSGGNAGAQAFPILVPAPMYVKDYWIRSTDTAASARTAEIALYATRQQNSATIDRIPGSLNSFAFTPSGAASNRGSGTVNLYLPPGFYICVIRNTHSTNTFGLGFAPGPTFQAGANNWGKVIAALGATLDIVTGWTGGHGIPAITLRGAMPDGSTS